MPLFRVQRFPHRFNPRRKRDKTRATEAGNETMQSELKRLVNTVGDPAGRKVIRFTASLVSAD
jgi:hypothetical protein